MRLRSYLAMLVLAGMVPLVALTSVVTLSLVQQQRTAVDRGLTDTVTALATAVDNEVETSIKSLQTLAASRHLDTGDLPAFYEHATRVVSLHRWSTIGLTDAEGRHLLNVARPFGAPLPDVRDREYFKQVVATRHPYVSDLITGRATNTVDVAVAVPVMRDERLAYVLFAGVEPSAFNAVLQAQKLPPLGVASVVSRDGLFVARTPRHAEFVGRAPRAEYLAQLRATPEGIYRGLDALGIQSDTAYRRMAVTGWTVGFELPADVQSAPVRRIAWAGGLGGAGLVFAALALSAWFARRMETTIDTLGAATSQVGRGEALGASLPLRIAELDEIRRHLGAADTLLQARARERDALLRAERAARAEAEAASSAKDQFLAMLGHELRNPLGAIAGAVSVLDHPAVSPRAAADAHGVIARQVQHLTRLVDDLLDVSRVTTGKISLDCRPLDLAALVDGVIATQRASGQLARHDVRVDARPVWVDGDATRLEQVVSNLVGNALKYTPAGGRVHVRVAPDGDVAVLEVADTGIGIEPHLIARVFDLFVQDDRPLDRALGGLGLGLTLVRTLVEMHGGQVRAESAGRGQGAAVTVRLPRVASPDIGRIAAATTPGARGRQRILVVEDNEDARTMLRLLLAMDGHEVHEAATGSDGVGLAAKLSPDVVLIDVGLPDVDGYEVARRIRAAGPDGLRLIAVTGYGKAEDLDRAQKAGFDAHLTKPILPDVLARLVAPPSGDGSPAAQPVA